MKIKYVSIQRHVYTRVRIINNIRTSDLLVCMNLLYTYTKIKRTYISTYINTYINAATWDVPENKLVRNKAMLNKGFIGLFQFAFRLKV